MREALARTDHDFVMTAPRPRRASKKSQPGLISQFGAALRRRPGRTFAFVVFAGLLCGVAVNALYFQTARHPAPIFKAPVAARPAQPATPPAPPPRPVEKAAPAQQQQAAPPVPPAPVPHARTNEPPARDQIGALLSGGAPAPASHADNSARVMAAQKALVKLGYVLKPDGVMGSGTRKAVEMFEQSRKLPVTGELSSRVIRELSALSGVAVP